MYRTPTIRQTRPFCSKKRYLAGNRLGGLPFGEANATSGRRKNQQSISTTGAEVGPVESSTVQQSAQPDTIVVNSIQCPIAFEVEVTAAASPPNPSSPESQTQAARHSWGKYSHNHRALVLDAAYRPVNVINWIKAIKMDMAGRADVLTYYEDGCVPTARELLPMPAVVRARRVLDISSIVNKVPLSRRNLMMRDKYTCQYCGCKPHSAGELTLDHVIPISKGGKNTWQNLVSCCKPCNQRKGNLTLKQLGWKLNVPLKEPTPYELKIIVSGLSPMEVDNPPPEWADFLTPYREKIMARLRANDPQNNPRSTHQES